MSKKKIKTYARSVIVLAFCYALLFFFFFYFAFVINSIFVEKVFSLYLFWMFAIDFVQNEAQKMPTFISFTIKSAPKNTLISCEKRAASRHSSFGTYVRLCVCFSLPFALLIATETNNMTSNCKQMNRNHLIISNHLRVRARMAEANWRRWEKKNPWKISVVLRFSQHNRTKKCVHKTKQNNLYCCLRCILFPLVDRFFLSFFISLLCFWWCVNTRCFL